MTSMLPYSSSRVKKAFSKFFSKLPKRAQLYVLIVYVILIGTLLVVVETKLNSQKEEHEEWKQPLFIAYFTLLLVSFLLAVKIKWQNYKLQHLDPLLRYFVSYLRGGY